MCFVFLKGNKFAPLDRGPRFIDERLRPCHVILVVFGGEFGNAIVDQLAGRLFNRREIASRNMGFNPSLLFGGERD